MLADQTRVESRGGGVSLNAAPPMTSTSQALAETASSYPASPVATIRVPESRRIFYVMDGLRGVAALFVVTQHAADWFKHIRPASSYLAVDLFFALSGFVIALSYEERLTSGLSVGGFLRIRLLRLYPLYLFGTMITLLFAVYRILLAGRGFSTGEVVQFGLALAMLPALSDSGSSIVYPLNLPGWSLLSELIVNAAYAWTVRRLTDRWLFAGVAFSACGLIWAGLHYGDLQIGFQQDTFLPSLFRTAYSFQVGLVLFRVWRSGRLAFSVAPWLIIAALMIVLTVPVPPTLRPFYDLLCALVVFPLIILLSASSKPTAWSRNVFGFLGMVSYPIYMIHVPLYDAFKRLLPASTAGVAIAAPASGILFLLFLVALGYLLNGFYDRPLRRFLSR